MDRDIVEPRNYRLVIQACSSAAYDYPIGEEVDVQASACLRFLSGRRSVWQATCRGRQILLKVYDQHPKQVRDANREWNHSLALYQQGLSMAAPLFSGSVEGGLLAVAYEFLSDGKTLVEYLAEADESGRRNGLRELLYLHAHQHNAGCFQADDHLGNYLWSEGKLYMLDLGSCVIKSESLSMDDRVRNMAMLTANISLPDRQVFDEELAVYLEQIPDNIDREQFDTAYRKAVPKAVKKRLRAYRRKTRRSSGKFERVDTKGRQWYACRDMDQELKARLLVDPDQFFIDAPLLKDGNTCTVVGFGTEGREYVLKRYNRKPLSYRLLRMWMPVRALKSWTGGHALRLFGIPTPRPVACLVVKSGLVMKQAYLLMESVSGRPLDKLSDSEMKKAAGKFAQRWFELDVLQVSHGDLKASNLILADDGTLTLIDLDSIAFHSSTHAHEHDRKKEWSRFLRNWKNQPDIQAAICKAVEGN